MLTLFQPHHMTNQPQPIDWPGIRTAAVTLGIRGAARAAAADLPPDELNRFVERVMKRAQREGWEDQRVAILTGAGVSAVCPQRPELSTHLQKPLSANVRNGAEIAANTDADLSKRSRTAALKYSAKTLEYAAEMDAQEGLMIASDVSSVTKVAALAGGWAAQGTTNVQINVLRDRDFSVVEQKVIDVEQA